MCGYQFFRWRNGGCLGYNRTPGTFHVGSAWLLVGSRAEDFSLVRRFLAEAGPRAELDHVNTLQEPKDGLGCSYYDLVRFEDETEARPSLVGA
jgi:hypothetical protein